MRVIVLGAGIVGVSTAWHLLEHGHDVTVVDRQPGAALETSFANAAQISVSYCEPWANREAPLKALKWMFSNKAPLLFRPQLDVRQWLWGLQFLAQCNDTAFERNVQQLVALGAYSHSALKDVVRATAIDYNRLERGIAHFYTDQKSFDAAGNAAALMRKYGVDRKVVSKAELLTIEPAYQLFAHRIVGGTYTASDESGDARVFTQALAERCVARGAVMLYGHDVTRLNKVDNAIESVAVCAHKQGATGQSDAKNDASNERLLIADAVVAACGSYTAPLLRTVGVNLPIYPGKGYSATFKLLKPDSAPFVSAIDDEVKCAMSRLGDFLRVAGTIELGGFDTSLTSSLAKARCAMLPAGLRPYCPACATPGWKPKAARLTSGPGCGPLHPPIFRILAKAPCANCGLTPGTEHWAGRTAQAQAKPSPS